MIMVSIKFSPLYAHNLINSLRAASLAVLVLTLVQRGSNTNNHSIGLCDKYRSDSSN